MLKIKCLDSRVSVHILASTIVPFTLTTVQVPNLALTHMKRITVWVYINRLKTMNVEIGTKAAQFPGKKYINGIFVAVRYWRAM